MGNLSIDFYDKTHGSIKILQDPTVVNSNNPNIRYRNDLMMFMCFTFRNFKNNGKHPAAIALAEEMEYWEPSFQCGEGNDISDHNTDDIEAWPHHILLNAAINMGYSSEMAEKSYGNPIWFVPHRGDGNHRFIGKLEIKNGCPVFSLNSKGFGLLGNDIPLYSNDAVMVFLSYLAFHYRSNPDQIEGIKTIARSCAHVYLNNQLSIMNQEIIALRLIKDFVEKNPLP